MEDFNNDVLLPVLKISDRIDDASELFLQSWQLIEQFKRSDKTNDNPSISKTPVNDEYANYKVGQIANKFLRMMLQNNAASAVEVGLMQNKDYSKTTFGIDFPLLVRYDSDYDRRRYWKVPLYIYGIKYMLCSQWYEQSSNNDRQPLLVWIDTHKNNIKLN